MIIIPSKKSIKKVYDDGYINKETYKAVLRPLNSTVIDDVIFSGHILKNELVKNMCNTLNDEQSNALKVILEYTLNKDNDIRGILLNGSAGTGKTTTISKFLYIISALCPSTYISINAPTHKAIKLLESKCNNLFTNKFITFGTTHHTLGLYPSMNSDGKIHFKGTPKKNSKYELMIIDEVSMIEDELFKLLLSEKCYKKTKFIFLGDKKQLPPINTEYSYIFRHENQYNISQINLTQVVRQVADNPIIKLTKDIGDHINVPYAIVIKQELTNENDGVITRSENQLESILKYWVTQPNFLVDSNFLKVLAWTNVMVNRCNNMIRKFLWKDPTIPFNKGEKIIANEPLFYFGSQFADNSDEFTVSSFKVITEKMTIPISKEEIELDFYDIELFEVSEHIKLVHKNSKPLYYQKLENLRNYCISKHDPKLWEQYYSMVQWNNNISYAYATTVHKSQGSTYENCIVMFNDIQNNRNYVEKNKLMYTAFTRAKKKLIIIS